MYQMHRVRAIAIGVLVVVVASGCARLATGQERANDAWSERLTRQAEYYQERSAERERAMDAWSDRLSGLAEESSESGMSDRAKEAWTERLEGLAEEAGGD